MPWTLHKRRGMYPALRFVSWNTGKAGGRIALRLVYPYQQGTRGLGGEDMDKGHGKGGCVEDGWGWIEDRGKGHGAVRGI